MANADHLALLREGRDAWNAWRGVEADVVPDLKLADLTECDLSGYIMDCALLDGANMLAVTAEGTSFRNASMRGVQVISCDFARATLVDTVMEESTLRGVVLVGCQARNARLQNTVLIHADMRRMDLSGADFRGAKIVDCTASALTALDASWLDAHVERCRFAHGRLDRLRVVGSTLIECDFTDASLAGACITTTELLTCSFAGAACGSIQVRDCGLVNCEFCNADLGRAQLIGVDFDTNAFQLARLAGAEIVAPRITIQRARASWAGRLIVPRAVFDQPVQDVTGLDPQLRRDIADVQFLRTVEARSRASWPSSIAFRLWGVSSQFGQSLARCLVMAMLLLMALTIASGHVRFSLDQETATITTSAAGTDSFVQLRTPRYLEPASAVYMAASMLVGFEPVGFEPVDLWGQLLIISGHVAGFTVMGVIISVVVTRFARLGAL